MKTYECLLKGRNNFLTQIPSQTLWHRVVPTGGCASFLHHGDSHTPQRIPLFQSSLQSPPLSSLGSGGTHYKKKRQTKREVKGEVILKGVAGKYEKQKEKEAQSKGKYEEDRTRDGNSRPPANFGREYSRFPAGNSEHTFFTKLGNFHFY
jgi:hypothetical protein